MVIVSRSSSSRPKSVLKQARALQQNIAKLGDAVQKLDNKPGVDADPEVGKIEFSGQEFQSELVSGPSNGTAELVDGQLDDFRFPSSDEHGQVWFSRANGTTYMGAPNSEGSMTVAQQADGTLRVSQREWLDPSTPLNKTKRALRVAKDVALRAVGTAIPLVGLGVASLANFFNDSDKGLQIAQLGGNALGTGLLIAGGMAASPFLLAAAGVSLVTAGVAGGIQSHQENSGGFTDPYMDEVTWSYPAGS
jgi:hypothetical protein